MFCSHGSMCFRATMYGSQKSHYLWLKCHENEEKTDNDYVFRNVHRINTAQPISMNLVSFFHKTILYLLKSKYAIFSNNKVTKFERSTFGGTPGIEDWTINYTNFLARTHGERLFWKHNFLKSPNKMHQPLVQYLSKILFFPFSA